MYFFSGFLVCTAYGFFQTLVDFLCVLRMAFSKHATKLLKFTDMCNSLYLFYENSGKINTSIKYRSSI